VKAEAKAKELYKKELTMGLRITISEIAEENAEIERKNLNDELGFDDDEERDEAGAIILTSHTVKNCKGVVEDVPGKSIFASRAVNAIELSGIFNIADQSQEHANVCALFDWFKTVSHDKRTYKKIEVSRRTGGNVEYENITFDRAFVVDYKENASIKHGTVEFGVFVRRFEDDEEAVEVQ